MPLRDPITSPYCCSGILKLNGLFNFEVAKLIHQIIHKKTPKNFESHFTCSSNSLISQHTPLVKNLQTNCFYLVFILLECNNPQNSLAVKSGIVFLMTLEFYLI